MGHLDISDDQILAVAMMDLMTWQHWKCLYACEIPYTATFTKI